MAHNWTSEQRAYFDSEAVRPLVSAGDTRYTVAVARINEDGGKAWRAWLAANEWCHAPLRAAYEAENARARQAADRNAELTAAFDALAAGGLSRNQAAKKLIRERPALAGCKPIHLFRRIGR